MVGRAWLIVAALAAGCVDDAGGFVCNTDDQCLAGQTCTDHACSDADATCPSGMRFTSTAGSRAGSCAPIPTCGNGVLDPGETCDPGSGSPTPCPMAGDCDSHDPCVLGQSMGEPCHQFCFFTYPVGDGDPCPAPDGGVSEGLCQRHSCCRGCWDGTNCGSGNALTACGRGGKSCSDCDQGDECTAKSCNSDGSCGAVHVADHVQCDSGKGACLAGACCEGCIGPNGCEIGNAITACGAGGASCVDCTSINSPCVNDMTGTHCGGCNKGCLGKSCGDDGCGGSCGTCGNNEICKNGTCTCNGNVENDDTLCADGVDNDCNGQTDCADQACDAKACSPMGGAFCSGGTCKAACRIGGKLYPANAKNPNNSCQYCNPKVNDAAWSEFPDNTGCILGGNMAGRCSGGVCCAC
jgi:hypothetical protein